MTPDDAQTGPSWGLLPEAVIALLRQKQWQNTKKLKALLMAAVADETPFPICVSLKPPNGKAALEEITHFQQFVAAWKSFSQTAAACACDVCWEQRSFRHLCDQAIPSKLIVPTISALAHLLAQAARRDARCHGLERPRAADPLRAAAQCQIELLFPVVECP